MLSDSACLHALLEILQYLPLASREEQLVLVQKLYGVPPALLEKIFLQVSHICITHEEPHVQENLRCFMHWLSGRSFIMALRLSLSIDSTHDLFQFLGLGDRVKEIHDKIESFAINRRGSVERNGCNDRIEEEIKRKELRLKLFNDQKMFLSAITRLSKHLLTFASRRQRQIELKKELAVINKLLESQALIYPLGRDGEPVRWVVNIAVEDCVVFFSRERAPFLLRCEVIVDDTTTFNDPSASKLRLPDGRFKISPDSDEVFSTAHAGEKEQGGEGAVSSGTTHSETKLFRKVFGELPEERAARLRRQSRLGNHPNWGISTFIVKSGDNLRQEELALQLVEFFNTIWKNAGVACTVVPYGVLSVGVDSGIIECVDGACSVDGIKKTCKKPLLHKFFDEAFGAKDSRKYREAQKKFVETMAGYSIFTYMMQVKDRHNGNILIMNDGSLVHIDFGFMLVTSPGGLNFESAPFKLSQELLEVMGGVGSSLFNYFKILFYLGMKAIRDRADDIIALVSLMAPYNTLSCFGSSPEFAIRQLRSRFRLDLESEAEFALYVKELIVESADNWRTRRYDQFQSIQNGIW